MLVAVPRFTQEISFGGKPLYEENLQDVLLVVNLVSLILLSSYLLSVQIRCRLHQ